MGALLTRMGEMTKEAASANLTLDRCADCGRYAVAVDTVTIASSEYELLKAKACAADLGTITSYRKMSSTRIARNPQYAEFLLALLPTMTVNEAFAQFTKRFGVKAASRSQVYRFAADMGLTFARR